MRAWSLLAALAASVLVCLSAAVPATAVDADVVAFERVGKQKRFCDSVDVIGLPVRNGCLVRAKAPKQDLRFTVITPFGSMKFADCEYRYTAHIASDGATWLGFLRTGGGNPCGDMQPCLVEGAAIQRPWSGRIHADGQGELYMRVDICLDTCMGWFEGKTRLDLDRVGGAWRIRADKAMVGDSGLEVDGEWTTKDRNLQLQPAPDQDG
jgi:hypothetical protein